MCLTNCIVDNTDTVMIHYEAFVGSSKTPFDSTFAVMRPYLFEVGMHQVCMCYEQEASTAS